MSSAKLQSDVRKIIFYDGECGLCERTVQRFLKWDVAGILQYAPLQGETAKALLPESLRTPDQLSTVVYFVDGKTCTKSDAILKATAELGTWRSLANLALLVPSPIRNWVYDRVAESRHRWFPKTECRLPTDAERGRFLP